MISDFLKRAAACLPPLIQHELKCWRYRRQILCRCFKSEEPEYNLLDSLMARGDWALDIGANVGHYTRRLSDLVGPEGHVIAIEPVAETFSLLAANTRYFKYDNVTLMNFAASDRFGSVAMAVPHYRNGLKNYYEARITRNDENGAVLAVPVDFLQIPFPIRLVKIDVEGHELPVLIGMQTTIRKHHPLIIMEKGSVEAVRYLERLDYHCHDLPNSPNHLLIADKNCLRQ
ncbi:FkbM family methyltransferase [Candidatus Zixiibacteriota bacterium]|nr:FkbM family methyltransferase [candidate division Zixibacteria bacterium]